jgi:general secretion pathway protein C
MPSPAAYRVIGERNLFRALRGPTTPLISTEEDLEESKLRLRLLGTVAAHPPSASLATLEDLGTRESVHVRIGDKISGATVLDIQRRRIVIENNGRREAISIDDEQTSPVPATTARRASPPGARTAASRSAPPRRSAPAATPPPGSLSPTRPLSSPAGPAASEPTVQARALSLASQVQFAPAYSPDGSIAGLQIQQVTAGSAMEEAGMTAGMICTEMNGLPISSLGSVSAALQPTPGSQICLTCIGTNGAAVTHCF